MKVQPDVVDSGYGNTLLSCAARATTRPQRILAGRGNAPGVSMPNVRISVDSTSASYGLGSLDAAKLPNETLTGY